MLLAIVQGVCTGLGLGENLREFLLMALYAVAGEIHLGRPVMVCALFAPNEGLHFRGGGRRTHCHARNGLCAF